MHEACADAGVQLMIAYRLHFDPLTLEAVRIAQEELGPLRTITATFSMTVEAPDIRLGPPSKGGGPLYDIGVYCINAARMLFRSDPIQAIAVGARVDVKRFEDCDTSVAAILVFPGGRLATFAVTFDGQRTDEVHLVGRDGHLRLSPAFGHSEELRMLVERGERRPRETVQRVHDQFGPQIDTFSACVRDGLPPEPDWRDGLADVRIVECLQRSIETGGRPVRVDPVPRGPRPTPAQGISRRSVEPPEEVRSAGPSEPRARS
jgi:predicted dehydrogenase